MLEQCARVASELGYGHLSTGDLLREEQKNDSALAKEIDECIRYNYCTTTTVSLLCSRSTTNECGMYFESVQYCIVYSVFWVLHEVRFKSSAAKDCNVCLYDRQIKAVEPQLLQNTQIPCCYCCTVLVILVYVMRAAASHSVLGALILRACPNLNTI